ncbi:glycerol-3-phosphate dehydrogenase [Methylopila capsulata]|uniref:FAD/NAD(P)-binding oxidoreductase n=1 Tax=Methylopila capsulata TaxID=61654 RepID=A0A9W6IQ57_9HYPH|nr:NAD(P)/FAD-dependent oxidoreductase [Methylopila capsulata]MBM7851101.1 glycerol-3-phosphate dehydrogenase [Methylopila capsulata]GLK54158.1 FAD/NAD(P)-binding oxidoreductase [Methylopila capsulata]
MPLADVAIIGAGAVGCAMARRFALEGAKVLVLERGADLLSGASKANSAILHTGFDAPPGSLEQACVQAGYAEYMAIRGRLNLPVLETGAMVVAWTEAEQAALDGVEAQARANSVDDVRRLGPAEIRAREPHLGEGAREALLVPREHVIDPWSPFLAYLLQAKALGAEILFGAEVAAGRREEEHWRLETSRGRRRARVVINCAGLYGDVVDRRLLGESAFEIRPRKGQFVVFDKAAASLLRTIVLPVPTERTKGVVLCRTAFGNVLVGPTAEEQQDRDRAATDEAALKALIARAVEMLPALEGMPVTATYAGLRPATEEKGYRIAAMPDRSWITVGGVRSTGMTAALGIARHVYGLYERLGHSHAAVAEPECPPMPNLAEHLPRDWSAAGHGGVVCHCELVTKREIEQALAGPLPAGDFGGLRRRTRCAMGRCQGFHCLARLAVLTEGRFAAPLATPTEAP